MSSRAHGKDYPIRFPRFAAGVRAQGLKENRAWWAQRWWARLAEMDLGGRLARGKHYAAAGQVVSLACQGSHVAADVVGCRAGVYHVTLDFRTPEGAAREQIVAQIKAEPIFLARLLVNELPFELEGIFRAAGYDLFPGEQLPGTTPEGRRCYDMTTACSCPDYANPCKHVGAVLLVLGEEIARNPWTLLRLRGLKEEDFYDKA